MNKEKVNGFATPHKVLVIRHSSAGGNPLKKDGCIDDIFPDDNEF